MSKICLLTKVKLLLQQSLPDQLSYTLYYTPTAFCNRACYIKSDQETRRAC
jgi:hypothetical protein